MESYPCSSRKGHEKKQPRSFERLRHARRWSNCSKRRKTGEEVPSSEKVLLIDQKPTSPNTPSAGRQKRHHVRGEGGRQDDDDDDDDDDAE